MSTTPAAGQTNQIQVSKELDLAGAAPMSTLKRRGSDASNSPSEARTTITQAVANAQQQARTFDANQTLTEQQELQTLRQIIVTWRELEQEASDLAQQAREKKVKQKALEEMILRIMKKYNIGALDLKGSGGRLLYRRQTTKTGLTPKALVGLLSDHLKSETAAQDAIKYINEHRGSRVRESLLYEKD